MMQLDFKQFLIFSGMRATDPRAIPEFEIMANIARLLPASTTTATLVRFWKQAFANRTESERKSVYRVRRGTSAAESPKQTLHLSAYDFIAYSNMHREDESWYSEFIIMRRIAAMVPASTPTSAVRRLWRDSFRQAPLSERVGVRLRRPVPDIYAVPAFK